MPISGMPFRLQSTISSDSIEYGALAQLLLFVSGIRHAVLAAKHDQQPRMTYARPQ